MRNELLVVMLTLIFSALVPSLLCCLLFATDVNNLRRAIVDLTGLFEARLPPVEINQYPDWSTDALAMVDATLELVDDNQAEEEDDNKHFIWKFGNSNIKVLKATVNVDLMPGHAAINLAVKVLQNHDCLFQMQMNINV